ncbi:putative BPI/LBP family protein At1g04970 [Silene latifolia]|uniref:putative BPI/LBP family protein At1g04970 n=1 Tax=Silene latifolia TaxID=37657 RepID=UPI003D777BB3
MATNNQTKTLIFFSLISVICIISSAHLQSHKNGFISVTISEKGLDFVKDFLIDKAVSSITPLELPDIEKTVKIILIGKVKVVLSNIVIYHIDVSKSKVELDDDGVTITASKATANLSMDWMYTYKNWLVQVTDKGKAFVQVEDLEVELTTGLKNKEGSLKLSVEESKCDVDDIDIKVEGGASWLYQGLVDAFSDHIENAVEKAILGKINEGVSKIGSLLASLPKEIKVDDTSELNVTFVGDPILDDASIGFMINGLFIPTHGALSSPHLHQISKHSTPCYDHPKMIAMSLHEDVFNSASAVYFNAGLMKWRVDKIPDQSLLNTTKWIEVAPQLYKQYPNDKMVLDILSSSPPSVRVSDGKMEATVSGDVTINVLNDGEVIPVACVSLAFSASGFATISGNNLTGGIDLNEFSLSAKWSKIGNLQIDVIEPMISEVLKDGLLPQLNLFLMQGFPLPLIHGFQLRDAKVVYANSAITVCSDVVFVEDLQFSTKYSFQNILNFGLFM